MIMKLNITNTLLIALLTGTLAGTSSCDKVDFGTINDNPNQTAVPVTSALLTNAISGIGARSWDAGGLSNLSGYYSQLYTETQYTEASRYAKTTTNWDGVYAGVLYDLQNIINYNSDSKTADLVVENGSNANQIAVARILKAYNFWYLTDLWGDIPYFEALKAQGAIPYDSQELIYADLLKELKEAVDQFDAGAAAKGDILYNGNIAAWKKFGNSIRLLIALQMSKANPTLGKSEFVAALSHPAGVIDENSENAALSYPGGNFLNPVYNYYNVTKRDDLAVTATLLDFLNATGDLRNTKFGGTALNAPSTVGFPYGLTRDNAVAFANTHTNFARPLIAVSTATTAVPVVTAAHVFLARAEAAQLTWTGENVEAMYNAGITASWQQWGINNAGALGDYLAHADVALAGGDVAEKIATQRWIGVYPNGWQAWDITRKTGFPVLSPAPGMPQIPVRLNYGTNEPQLNPENYATAAAKFTANGEANSQYAPVWWDK